MTTSSDEEAAVFFKGIPLFAGLSDADHGLLLQVAVRRSYPRNTLLIQEGDAGENLYLLRHGRAKIFMSDGDGREVILAILSPGEFIGEMSLIDDEPCSASVMTLEESEFVSVNKTDFRRVLASSPSMAVNLLKALSQRLRESDQQIEALALKDVQARVEQALQQLAVPEGRELVVPPRITHRDIASMVGASREMVTRVIRHLEETGFVRTDGRRITVMPAGNPKK
jgi:CRP/FNR family cyclic AMP-dependent transcriptional regulator